MIRANKRLSAELKRLELLKRMEDIERETNDLMESQCVTRQELVCCDYMARSKFDFRNYYCYGCGKTKRLKLEDYTALTDHQGALLKPIEMKEVVNE